MNAVILIILSLFATIGIAYIIDAVVKSILYDKAGLADMELVLYLRGDGDALSDMVRIFIEDSFTYKTRKGYCRLTLIDKGLSKRNQENMENIALYYNNVSFIKDTLD